MTLEEKRAKRNAYLAEWRAKNRESIREAQKRYYDANRDVCNQRVKDCKAKNKAYYSAKTMEWQANNREQYLQIRRNHYAANSASEIAKVRRRKGRIKHGELLMNKAEIAEIQGLYDFCRVFAGFEVDHIIPLNGKTVSGLHVLSNLQVLPVRENRSKSNKF
jgi:C4-dicarboxylate-specific signal transduction histidine kinase